MEGILVEEVITLENKIRAALPAADAAAGHDATFRPLVAFAQGVLCNAWTEPGLRLDRLRKIAREIAQFAPDAAV